jgi:hypothetical protein
MRDNINNVRRDANRHFRNKTYEYLKTNIEELETASKNKDIRYLVTDYYIILSRWRNDFHQRLNVHVVNEVTETEKQTAQPIVHEPSASEVELATENLRSHISPGIDQIAEELFKAECRRVRFQIHNILFLFGIIGIS